MTIKNILSGVEMQNLIKETLRNGDPLTILENETKADPCEVFTWFSSLEGAQTVLYELFGEEVGDKFLKQGGNLLNVDKMIIQKQSAEEWGLATTGSFDTLRLMFWLTQKYCGGNRGVNNLEGLNLIDSLKYVVMVDDCISFYKDFEKDLDILGYSPVELSSEYHDALLEVANTAKDFSASEVENIKKFFELADEVLADTDYKFLLRPEDLAVLGWKREELPSCVVVLDFYTRGTCRLSKEFVYYYSTVLSNTLGSATRVPPIKCVQDADGTIVMTVDGNTVYELTDSCVLRNGQEIQNMMLSHQRENLFLDSYGSFLTVLDAAIPVLVQKMKTKVGSWERRYVYKLLAIDNEELAGTESHGMRRIYNSRVTHGYLLQSKALWVKEQGYDEDLKVHTGGVRVNAGSLSRDNLLLFAEGILHQWNLFFSDKSSVYMDNRLLGTRLKDVPKNAQVYRIQQALLLGSEADNLVDAVRIIFGINITKESQLRQVMEILREQLITLKTTKTNKSVSRIQLNHATASNYVNGGVQTALVDEHLVYENQRKGLPNFYKRDIVALEPVALGINITSTAGTCPRWVGMPYAMVAKNFEESFENYDKEAAISIIGAGDTTAVDKPQGYTEYTYNTHNPLTIEGLDVISIHDYAGYNDDDGTFNPAIPLKGVLVGKGQTIAKIPYQIDGETHYHVVNAPTQLYVTKIRIEEKQFGHTTSFVVKVYGLYAINSWKMRGVMKAMPAPILTGRKYLYNSLNDDLVNGIVMMITKDCIKHKDLLKGELPYVATTALKNGFVHKLVEINEKLGSDLADGLYFTQTGADLGYYDELKEWFWTRYGQARWVYRRDIETGAWSIIQKALNERIGEGYWVKSTVAKLESESIVPVGKFPADASVYHSTIKGGVITEQDDILVFYNDGSKYCPMAIWQRSYVAASIVNEQGNPEHVYAEMKVEMSDFRANCTEAKLMGSIATNVATPNGLTEASPEFAFKLMGDYKQRVNNYAAFAAMAHNLPLHKDGEEIPVIKLFDDKGNLNSDIADQLFNEPALCEKLYTVGLEVKDILSLFPNHVLDMRKVKVYVPTLAAQDMLGKNPETTSGLLKYIVTQAFKGVSYDKLKGTITRLASSISIIIGEDYYDAEADTRTGLNIMRAMTQGRTSLLGKIVAIEGLPYKTVLPYSEDPSSAAQKAIALFNKLGYTKEEMLASKVYDDKETDPRVCFHRSPLTAQSICPLAFVRPNEYILSFEDEGVEVDLYWILVNFEDAENVDILPPGNIHLIFQQSSMILVQMGDCDGDGINLTPVDREITPSKISNVSLSDCETSIYLATSKEVWAKDQEGYTMDQMMPTPVNVSVITAPKALTKKNFKLLSGKLALDKEGNVLLAKDDFSWSGISYLAGYVKTNDVGAAYSHTNYICNCVSIVYAIARSLDIHKCNTVDISAQLGLPIWMCDFTLIKPSQELYEGVPLSGLSEAGRKVMAVISNTMFNGLEGIDIPGENKQGSEMGLAAYAEYENNVAEAGANPKYAKSYLYAAMSFKSSRKIFIPEGTKVEDYQMNLKEFIGVSSLLMFYASKGQLMLSNGDIQKMVVLYLNSCIDRTEFVKYSPILRWLEYALPILVNVQQYNGKSKILSLLGQDAPCVNLES